MISDEWNIATTYTVCSYCIYDNKLWKCKVQNSGQVPSEGTYWTKTQIDDEMLAIKNDVSTLNSNLTRKPNYNGGFDLGAKSYTTTQDCYICVGSRHSGTNAYTEIYINGNFAYSNYLFSNGEKIGFSPYLYIPKGSIISYDVNPIGDGIIYQTLFRIVPTV